MRTVVARLVDIRDGEGTSLFRAFTTLFGIIFGHTILETARDALFLSRLPAERLTWVYVLLAGLTLVGSALSKRVVRAFGRRNALIFSLLLSAYVTSMLSFRGDSPVAIFVLYLWSGLMATVMAFQFWMLAAQLFTLSQGKRLFGPLASGGVLGAASGAFTAAIILRFLPVKALLFVASGVFIATAFFLTTVEVSESRPVGLDSDGGEDGRPMPMRELLRSHPYLLRVAGLVVFSTAAVLVTDYLFKMVAAEHYEGQDLGEFLARYYAGLNALALIVQIALAPRLLQSQGVLVSSLVLPALLLVGSGGVLVLGGLASMVLVVKGADGTLRHSLHRVTSELLWMPVPPTVRDGAKAFIDGALARATQASTAGVIMLLGTLGVATPRTLGALIVVLAGTWLGIAFSLRTPYVALIRQALRRGMLEDGELMRDLDIGSVEAILEAMSSRDPNHVLAALDLLAHRKRGRLIPALILYHEADEVLVRAIHIFASDPTRIDWLPHGERLLLHPSESVRVATMRAFVARRDVEMAKKGLLDASPAVRAHAAFFFAHEEATLSAPGEPPRDPRHDPAISALLALEGDDGRRAHLALLDAIRDLADVRWSELVLEMASCDDQETVERAAATMAEMKDPRFIPVLIERLKLREGRSIVRTALARLGDPALDALERALRDPRTDPRIRLHIPRSISRFASQRAVDILLARLADEPNGRIRYKILRGLGRLLTDTQFTFDRERVEAEIRRNLIEHLRISAIQGPITAARPSVPREAAGSADLLEGLLQDKARQALERAFRLLQIAHRSEDIRSVYLALQSSDRQVRAHAQEFIDVVTSSRERTTELEDENRELWRIVADDLTPTERAARASRFLPPIPASHVAALSMLVREGDEYLASLAGYHALEVGTDDLRDQVIEAYEERPSLRQILAQVTVVPRLAQGGVRG